MPFGVFGYTINPEQAETVRLIYDLYLNHDMGTQKIAKELTRLHRKAASGEIKWTQSNVGRVLNNPTYMGCIAYGKSFSNNYLEQKRVNNHDRSTYMYMKGDFEPIISEEDWYKCEKMRKSRLSPYLAPSIGKKKETHTQRPNTDLWASKMLCDCGGHFRKNRWHKNKNKDWSYGYMCYNKINNGSAKSRREAGMDDTGYCDMPEIAEWKLDAMAKMILEQVWGERKEAIIEACKILRECYQNQPARKAVNTGAVQAKIAQLQARIENLTDMRQDGEITKEEYKKRCVKVESEISTLQAEMEEAPPVVPMPKEAGLRFKEIEATLSKLIDFSEPTVDKRVVDKFVCRIVPKGDNRYAWYLNLDNGIAEKLTAACEGRKQTAAVFLDDGKGDGEPSPPVHSICLPQNAEGSQQVLRPLENGLKSRFSADLLFVLQTTYSGLSRRKSCDRHSER
ncbi:MAG: recombinase family protein [Oscillospiraceae bacterium]|jgi:hypothetical protein|nr:recombinase family protein [Oscillospiraceae bacterium]